MKYKTLKHKYMPETFGVFVNHDEGEIRDADTEIYFSAKPELLGIETTIDKLKELNKQRTSFEQLDDYEVIDIEVLLKNELPSEKLEKQVLSDYLDWYKNRYGGVEMISDYWINEFLNHTA